MHVKLKILSFRKINFFQFIMCSAGLKSNIKVIRNPCEAGIVIGWIRRRLAGWRKESYPLEKIDSEEKYLISCQYFPHTVPLANTKWNHPFILYKPKTYFFYLYDWTHILFIPFFWTNPAVRIENFWLTKDIRIIGDEWQIGCKYRPLRENIFTDNGVIHCSV